MDQRLRSLRLAAMYWEEGSDKEDRGEEILTREVSLQGLTFESPRMQRLGATLETEIFLPGRPVPVECALKVKSLEPIPGKDLFRIGAEFSRIAPNDGMEIVGVLEKLDLYKFLSNAVEAGASDIHLTVGRPPMIRYGGKLREYPGVDPIVVGDIQAMLYPLLTNAQVRQFEDGRELNFAFSPDSFSRWRINMHWQRGYAEAALRSVTSNVKSFKELKLPGEALEMFCRQQAGLVLICGTTGAGKTTTMSAMVNYINKNFNHIVVTVEDPIEYIHRNDKSVIKQREIGSDTLSYPDALRHSLRQDPDVICVGEILEQEALASAMKAAETGHLVISTIHAPNTTQALQRAISLFPPEAGANVSSQLASALIGIVYQVLLPTKKGGRVPATEVLVNNNAMRNLIRENRFSSMSSVLQTGRKEGMYTLKKSIDRLIKADIVDPEILQNLKQLEYTN
ncbi:MAG: PilT/PilU family type 4a pilus ATPase [Planctomycetota bacterium]